MKTKHKLLVLVPLIMTVSGCKENRYTNVVQDIVNTKDKKMIKLRDVKDNKERILVLPTPGSYAYDYVNGFCKYLCAGDTIVIALDPICSERYYHDQQIIEYDFAKLVCNADTIEARKSRTAYDFLLNEFNRARQK